jgi:SAM-dependent methyltransferase
MEQNITKFSGRANEYDRYRERYNVDVVLPLLREWCGLTPQWNIADIGAGTGMLADVFLANGNHVVAVEPNADMRAMCAQLHASNALLEIREGTAENTGLNDVAFDMVCAGRAMHWFDPEISMREFHRILKPQGWVSVIAFGRTETGRAENIAFEDVLGSVGSTRESTHANYEIYLRLEKFFAGGEFHHREVLGEMKFDWESLLGMTMSLSHAPLVSSPRFPEFERVLSEYFDRYAQSGVVTLETRYWINAGRFAM